MFYIRFNGFVFGDFFDIFIFDIFSIMWCFLIDVMIDLYGEVVGDIFKGFLRSFGSSFFD